MQPGLKGVANRAAEDLFASVAGLAGNWLRPRAEPILSAGKVWVLAPHPDDELAGCGGTLLEHQRTGDRTRITMVSDGGASTALGLPRVQIAKVREQEAHAVAKSLGIEEFDWLGFPEMMWSAAEAIARFRQVLDTYRPDVIYAPSRIDFHPEHIYTAIALARALADAPSTLVRIYEIEVPLTPALTNRVFDVSSAEPRLRAAMDLYVSQQRTLSRTWRLKRYAARAHGATSLAETFWELDSRAYAKLHADLVRPPVTSPFRGARAGALRDPIAFGAGLAERRRLKRDAR